MPDSLQDIFDASEVRSTVNSVEGSRIARGVGLNGHIEDDERTLIRTAAIIAFSNLIGEQGTEERIRVGPPAITAPPAATTDAFELWNALIDTFIDAPEDLEVEDFIFFSAVGFLASRSAEVRAKLRRSDIRAFLDRSIESLDQLPWTDRVKTTTQLALIQITRQADRDDMVRSSLLLTDLSAIQKSTEAEWLEHQANPRRDSARLLGTYHLAQAIIRTSEFILKGSVTRNGAEVGDFAAELHRLLIKAEEFLTLSGSLDEVFALQACAVILLNLRSESIWVSGRNISDRIDQLLTELVAQGREQPVFSLLPSQRDALRQSLMDRSRIAVVLQMPTSAGKTLLAEFAIAQTFDAYRNAARCAYIVPTRALATQTRRTLAEDLGPLGIAVSAAGGAFEEDPYELNLLMGQDGVVVSTPEKLDLLLRAHPEWAKNLRLVVVDEAHLLGEKKSDRGVRLELLLANLRREYPQARLLLLTPFIQNANAIAAWLGQEQGTPIEVHWRPSRLLLGLTRIEGRKGEKSLNIEWLDPYKRNSTPPPLRGTTDDLQGDISTKAKRVLALEKIFRPMGTTMALFSASPEGAEQSALAVANERDVIPRDRQTSALRLAIALARIEYGEDSDLAHCLERGTAFHHSALSSVLRYLVEDQIRAKAISYVAATSTLAQGMNFPVATILIHSVHKPFGGGNFSSSEFWNIAGRAGRVGLADKGFVVFVSDNDRQHFERYSRALNESLRSAFLDVIPQLLGSSDVRTKYLRLKEFRPFIQFLAHAAATQGPANASRNLEEVLQSSLAYKQAATASDAQAIRQIANEYLRTIAQLPTSYLKTADETGLASFSFSNLFARVRDDPILFDGPGRVMQERQAGLTHLVDILKWLPELDLAIGLGQGPMSAEAVAEVAQGWMDGRQIHELAGPFDADEPKARVRMAARYVNSTVSSVLSWGAHAYLRSWFMANRKVADETGADTLMFPSYLQYGVHTPEAAVASLLGVPRAFAESLGDVYRNRFGNLTPNTASRLKSFIEDADVRAWAEIVERSPASGVNAADLRKVFRQMQGLRGE